MYKLEMHVHTSPVSHCASVSPEKVIETYRRAGYQGMVLTNHINLGTFTGKEELPWKQKVDFFLEDFYTAKKISGNDFDVLLGAEINFSKIGFEYIPNDYLVYGLTEEWLYNIDDPRNFTLKELSEKTREAGFVLVQAHPFRYGTVIAKDEFLDGVEVHNANIRHNSHNELAELWADMKGLIRTTGSDFHRDGDATTNGIYTSFRIRDNENLLDTLRKGKYSLLRP